MHYRAIWVQIYTKFSEHSQRENEDLIKAKQKFSIIINKDNVKNAPIILMGGGERHCCMKCRTCKLFLDLSEMEDRRVKVTMKYLKDFQNEICRMAPCLNP